VSDIINGLLRVLCS